ncbi:MAG: aldose 1-epimerase family protein [Fimbriimonadaceae bacterium]|nr:aldose 1-epimerase family protein [Fimbriimonadaceae bacterium]
MPHLGGRKMGWAELGEYLGDPSQLAGIDRLEYAEGPERGVELLRFRTGSGLDFDLLPGRGLDISHATYQGLPLAWISATGIPHSAHFEPPGLGWLRSFYGGLLSTCGLLSAGAPGTDPEHDTLYAGIGTEDSAVVKLGLHGRVNNTAARNVAADCHWDGDDLLLTAYGRVREAIVFGENVELVRRVLAVAGEPTLQIHDEVTNRGHAAMPHMMLYHLNFGWPVVSPDSVLLTCAQHVEPRDAVAAPGLPDCHGFVAPQASYPEQVYYHQQIADAAGFCHAAIVNRDLRGGFGIGLTYRGATLPELVQWKSMQRGTYVCGLEPANCRVTGRADERAAGRLRWLQPGEKVAYDLMLTVLDGPAAVQAFEAQLQR